MPRSEVFFDLVEAVAALPSLRGDAGRSVIGRLLPAEIAGTVRHDPRSRLYALNLVHACLDHDNGLGDLLAALQMLEGESAGMTRVIELAAALPRR
jgi:hypothetical protein